MLDAGVSRTRFCQKSHNAVMRQMHNASWQKTKGLLINGLLFMCLIGLNRLSDAVLPAV